MENKKLKKFCCKVYRCLVFEEIFLLKMGDYSLNEVVDMIRIVGETGNDYSAAVWLYSVRFPNRRHPKKSHEETF